MKFWNLLIRWLERLFGNGLAAEERLRLNMELARRDFKDAVTLVERTRQRLAALEQGAAQTTGEVEFCRQDLNEGERKATDAHERATRYYNDLRALTFQQKGQELAEAPVVSTAELEQVRRQVWVQRQLLECHEEVLNGLEQDEYGAERKQAVLGKPRSQTEPSPESGKVLDLPRPFALTEADTGEPAGAAQPAQTVMARGETRKDLEA